MSRPYKIILFGVVAVSAWLMLLATSNFYSYDALNRDSLTMPNPGLRNQLEVSGKATQTSEQPIAEPQPSIESNSDQIVLPEFESPVPTPHELLARIIELDNHPSDHAFNELLPLMSHADPAIRLAAVESLGDMTYRAAGPVLSAVLHDPDPEVRVAALEALAAHEDPAAASNIEPLLYDSVQEVRVAAVNALMDMELEPSVPALAGLLTDPDQIIRHQAVLALGEIGGALAMQYLAGVSDDPSPDVRINAISILDETD